MSEEDIERAKKAIPNFIKHPSGKFKIVVTDEMKNDFGELYKDDLKKRIKENGRD